MHGRAHPDSLPALKRQPAPPSRKGVSHTHTSPSRDAAGSLPLGQTLTSPAALAGQDQQSTAETAEIGASGRHRTTTTANRTSEASAFPPRASGATTSMRAERLKELEEYALHRAGRHATMPERQKALQSSLSLLSSLYPHLENILDSVQRYIEDMAAQTRRAEEEKAQALRQQEQKLYAEFETFFSGKVKELVVARKKAEMRAEAEHAAAFCIRQERDTELMGVKEELLQRLNECEHTEEQFRDFRHLIASVFQTNQQLMLRIDQLESVLTRHRISIPPANAELSAYKTSSDTKQPGVSGGGFSNNGSDGRGSVSETGVRALSTQVPAAFMAATNKELVKSRLTLQNELLHCAFDEQSAYRMRIEGLIRQNQDLKFHIAELEEKVKDLYTYIHEKRFITCVDESGNETTPLTPRPREVPLALQTELGIELRHSTANILSELATVAINMKHQLNSALLRTRQLYTLSTWLNEADTTGGDVTTGAGAVGAMIQQVTETAVIPVFPVASWPSIPHFLRTNVSPEVRNCFWTEAQAGCIFYNFFLSYKAVRARARFVRDGKMLAPRVYQLFEHRRVLLTRLDASKDDAMQSEENIPFGYVVSQFAREALTQLSPQNAQEALPLVLPGTISTRYPLNPPPKAVLPEKRASTATSSGNSKTGSNHGAHTNRKSAEGMSVEDFEWERAAPVVELEWTRFTYNMWYAALRYQQTQPLCQLFVDLIDGRLPLETFDVMEDVLARVQRLVDKLDHERSHRFTYPRLVNGVVRWVNDTGAQAVLRGVQAVVKSFESHHSLLHGGALNPLALFADETYCDREEAGAAPSTEKDADKQHSSFVPAVGTAVAAVAAKTTAARVAGAAREKPQTLLPGCLVVHKLPLSSIGTTASSSLALPPLGATVFVRYWRSFVRDTLERVYTRIETALAPLVEESEVVMGLYLLSVPRAKTVLAELDNEEKQAALRSAVFGRGLSADHAAFDPRNPDPGDTLTGARLVAEAASLLGVHGIAHSFLALLESRKGILQEKKMAERQVATETVMQAVQLLPLFKLSTHFPFRLQNEAAAAAARRLEDGEEEEGAAAVAGGQSSSLQPPTSISTNDRVQSAEKNGRVSRGSRASKKALQIPRKKAEKGPGTNAAAHPNSKDSPPSNEVEQNDSGLPGQRPKKRKAQKPPSSANSIGSRLKSWDFVSQRPNSGETARANFTAEVMTSSKEGELVEWYSLRHTLRQIMPKFQFLLFQPDAYERSEKSKDVAALPVLRAYDEVPPTSV